jgi:ankyrin repeat protein
VFVQSIKEATDAQMDAAVWHLFSANEHSEGLTNCLRPALEAAAATKNGALIKALLDAGASSDTQALVEAIRSHDSSIVSLLLNAGAEVNLDEDLNCADDADSDCSHETTPLEEAARWGDLAVLQRILQQGAETNYSTALTYVIHHQDQSLVTMLLDAGSRVDADRCSSVENPLQAAIRSGEICIVELLLNRGADVNGTTKASRWAPLHMAIERRRLDLVQVLLSAGADVNDPRAKLDGRSALALAIREDDANMVNFLLANAADPDDSEALSFAVSKKKTPN